MSVAEPLEQEGLQDKQIHRDLHRGAGRAHRDLFDRRR